MPGKHDKDHQEPPFLSMLNSNANKRLSFIDKGKSWVIQDILLIHRHVSIYDT